MKKSIVLTLAVFLLSIVFVAGCAKKTVLQEERTTAQEKAVLEKGAVQPEGKAAVTDKAAKDAAAREAAAREAAAREAAAREAAAKKAAPKEGAVKKEAAKEAAAVSTKELYEFNDVNFDFDKFNLGNDAREILKKHAGWLNKNKDIKIVVEGHCDERGTAEYNLALGQRRASAAAKFLVDMGIEAKRIKTVSYGEEMPLDPGHNENAWAKNRRAHFSVSTKK